MNSTRIVVTSFYVLLLCLAGCGGGGDSGGASAAPSPTPSPVPAPVRHFQMGFTPWLYEASFTAQDKVYEQIQDYGDIVTHHIMGGVPWQEAFDQVEYPEPVEQELSTRLSKTNDGKTVYLSIDSLNGQRSQLALNWGQSENEPRTGNWATRSFASPEVIEAYGNFALDLIDRFDPAYFNYAAEVGGLMVSDPEAFDEFVVFAEAIYGRIKAEHPQLPILVSLSLKTPGNEEMQVVRDGFARIADYVDMVGISIYPYALFDHSEKGDPRNMPDDWLSQITRIAPDKPVAATETAWAAENLVIEDFGANVAITAENQADYLPMLFAEAEQLNAAFVIWFCIDDYDILWDTVLQQDPVSRIWRDTGLFDGFLNARPALDIWHEWYQRPLGQAQ